MITYFKKLRKERADKKLMNFTALAHLKSIEAEVKTHNHILQTELSELSKSQAELTIGIRQMVETLAKYFQIELEFAEKEKVRSEISPTPDDKKF